MNKLLKYSIFGVAFIFVGLLMGFKIKGNIGGFSDMTINQGMKKLQQALVFIESQYVEDVNHEELIDNAIKGIMDGLDPHSFYIPKRDLEPMSERMDGQFDGIGIQYNIVEDTIYVETPLQGGPSEEVGILAGDRIVKVDGEVVAGIKITNSGVEKHLKGPRGTTVNVAVKRRNVAELIDFKITRDRIPINSVSYSYMINSETGFLQVTRFSSTTYDEFKDHLTKLKAQGMKNLILDLRGNPGGYMTMAYRMADEFLSGGKMVVSTEGRTRQSDQTYKSTSKLADFEEGGLIVLIDYGSASASEIVSGAIQDHDRGLVVGVRSFGKGLVQIQEEFDDGSAIRIVISKYFTPSGRSIQKPYDKTSEEYESEILARFESGEIYDMTKVEFPDSLKYSTASGRTVYGGGGIFPDVFVPSDTTYNSRYLTELYANDIFRQFSFEYVDSRPNLKKTYPDAASFVKKFKVSEALIKQFTDFASSKDVKFNQEQYNTSKGFISNRIGAFIGRRMYNDDAYYPISHKLDNVLQAAIDLVPEANTLAETGAFQLTEK